eukprot:7505548-Pyramimonas_sp.AAC.1
MRHLTTRSQNLERGGAAAGSSSGGGGIRSNNSSAEKNLEHEDVERLEQSGALLQAGDPVVQQPDQQLRGQQPLRAPHSDAGRAGIFSRRTNQTRDARVYSHDGRRKLKRSAAPRPATAASTNQHGTCGYTLTTNQSDAGRAGLFARRTHRMRDIVNKRAYRIIAAGEGGGRTSVRSVTARASAGSWKACMSVLSTYLHGREEGAATAPPRPLRPTVASEVSNTDWLLRTSSPTSRSASATNSAAVGALARPCQIGLS